MQIAHRRAGLLGAVLAALAVAAPAAAETYSVSGESITVDPDAGTARMTGGLLGDFKLVAYHQLAEPPNVRARGRERFRGCVDRERDGACTGDPSGTLRFRFLYWAQVEGESLIWGSCWHPVVRGTGAFRGARGVLTMVDTPQPDGSVRTDYIGTITTAGGATTRSAPTAGCA
ncbi:MAG TPA: hypothetical protein VFR97_10725 [Capillimicrobium sp.]|nr:hypothetical protein [Capillimicrobium sp.]